jgi:hypothetical protein
MNYRKWPTNQLRLHPSNPPRPDVIIYISASNEAEGPFKVIHIRELVEQQIITDDTLVVAEGDNTWVPFRQVPELAANAETTAAAHERFQDIPELDQVRASHQIATHEFEKSSPFSKVITEFAKTSTLTKKSLWQRLKR